MFPLQKVTFITGIPALHFLPQQPQVSLTTNNSNANCARSTLATPEDYFTLFDIYNSVKKVLNDFIQKVSEHEK